MNRVMHIVLLCVLTLGVASCGNKGKLKTPTQVKTEEAKKARKEDKNTGIDMAVPQPKPSPDSDTPPVTKTPE